MSPCGDICNATWCTCGRVYAYVRMYAYVCMCVINELSIIFRIFANSLITHTLYTGQFILIFAKWDYFYLFLRASYVANVKHAMACIKRQSSIFT